jgi:MFS family permease
LTTVVSFAALFLSVVLVQLSSGALGPLDALSGAALGFSKTEIGMLGSMHYAGFFAGCWAAPRLIGRVGHARTFAALAAVGAIGALLHPVIIDPVAWSAMRAGTGFAVAGAYTAVESWLNAKAENANRGRVFGVFRMVDLVGQLGAQGLIAVLEPAAYVSYNILALIACLCVLPLTLSRQPPPAMEEAPALRPWRTLTLSPLGASAAIVAGLTAASFRMVGPLFGAELGMTPPGIALFLAAAVAGGAVAQLPVGWISDRTDRRAVLVGLSLAAAGVCAAGMIVGDGAGLYVVAFLFGMAAFPLYSVGAAHANDFAPPGAIVELNASLMFLFGVGAIVSPLAAAELIDRYGPPALFAFIAAAHGVLILFGLWRMTRRPTMAPRTPYAWLPRTSFVLGRLLRRPGSGEG